MCMSTPKIPGPAPAPQAAKAPDSTPMADARRRQGMQGGSLLTGAMGAPTGPGQTGRTTLLGQ